MVDDAECQTFDDGRLADTGFADEDGVVLLAPRENLCDALNLGLAFQYEDDLLDGDSPYSREKTESLVRETTAASIAALEGLPGDTSFLKALAEKLVGRTV